MFGRQSGLSSSSGSGGNLIEFRAGRMNKMGKMVHPDHKKGLVYLTQSDDGLMHFCWKDRTTGDVEDDLIVFPDDFEFKRVDQCKTGRVYVLKFKTSTRRMFFWMQEPKADKDDEYCRRVNELMNNPPSAQRNNADGGDLQYMLNNMSQQQLMQLFGGVGQMGGLSSLLGSMNRDSSRTSGSGNRNNTSSSSGPVTPESTPSAPRTPGAPKGKSVKSSPTAASSNTSGNNVNDDNTADNGKTSSNLINTSEFQSYLSNLSPEAGASRSLNIDLSTALTGSEAINELIADPQKANTLSVHLPESCDSDEARKQQIKDTIASPQFQQALSLFSNALQSAQLGPVVSQFELTPDAVTAAFAGNLEDFVKALEKALPAGATMNKTKESAGINNTTTTKDEAAEEPSQTEEKKE